MLVDGRTIYTPLFSGVFWDQQDVLLEDVERIEVISGPGGTLWGANAVNGVINVITRSPRETQGTLASVGAGTERQGGGVPLRRRVRQRRGVPRLRQGDARRTYAARGRQIRRSTTGAGCRPGSAPTGARVQNGVTLQGDAHGVRSEDRGSVAGFVAGPRRAVRR